VSDKVSVLFANEAFYAAFADRDIKAMEELWSRRPDVTCIHPGWSPLVGHDSVMQSWRAILSNPASPAIICGNATAYVFADVAYVLYHENVEQTFLAATNVFLREKGGWKMVHHHAGPSPAPSFDPTSARLPLQ
jgi:ketosteroid isomerase-like protein